MYRNLFCILLLLLISGCLSESKMLDITQSQFTSETIDSAKNPRGIRYAGFTVLPMPKTRWQVTTPQSANRAQWVIPDKKEIMHTTIAVVTASPILSPAILQEYSLEKLRVAIDQKLASNPENRMLNLRRRAWIGTRMMRQVVEYECSCLDSGVGDPRIKPMAMFIRGFSTLNTNNQLISVTVSERFPTPEGTPDTGAAKRFLDAVRLD